LIAAPVLVGAAMIFCAVYVDGERCIVLVDNDLARRPWQMMVALRITRRWPTRLCDLC